MLTRAHICGRIQNLGWTQLESTLKTWGHSILKMERGCEALSSPENTRNPLEIIKSNDFEMNQDTYGDFLRYQESPGMTFDTTRRHKTEFQDVDVHYKSPDFDHISLRMSPISARIQNLGWTQLESMSKIIMVAVEISSFGYDLTFEICISEGFSPVA